MNAEIESPDRNPEWFADCAATLFRIDRTLLAEAYDEATRQSSVAVSFSVYTLNRLIGEHIVDTLHLTHQFIVDRTQYLFHGSRMAGFTGF